MGPDREQIITWIARGAVLKKLVNMYLHDENEKFFHGVILCMKRAMFLVPGQYEPPEDREATKVSRLAAAEPGAEEAFLPEIIHDNDHFAIPAFCLEEDLRDGFDDADYRVMDLDELMDLCEAREGLSGFVLDPFEQPLEMPREMFSWLRELPMPDDEEEAKVLPMIPRMLQEEKEQLTAHESGSEEDPMERLHELIRDYRRTGLEKWKKQVYRHLNDVMLIVPGEVSREQREVLAEQKAPDRDYLEVDAKDLSFTPRMLNDDSYFYIPVFTDIQTMFEHYGRGDFLIMNAPAVMELAERQDAYGGIRIDPFTEELQINREEFGDVRHQIRIWETLKKARRLASEEFGTAENIGTPGARKQRFMEDETDSGQEEDDGIRLEDLDTPPGLLS